jgi:hypothetical protein
LCGENIKKTSLVFWERERVNKFKFVLSVSIFSHYIQKLQKKEAHIHKAQTHT